MVKVIDIDSLFDKYIEKYVYSNIGKVKPEEIENKIPELYINFGKTKMQELDNNSPEEYYQKEPTSALLTCLKQHIENNVSVPDFLCEAVIKKQDCADLIKKELADEENEEYICYLINMLPNAGGKIPVAKYLEFALEGYSESVSELAIEKLKEKADDAKEAVLTAAKTCEESKKAGLSEILSACKKDEKVTNFLIEEFKNNTDKISFYTSLLVKYGDDRVIPHLIEEIKKDKIDYSDFEELRFAIEALGGEYTETRDFSNDKAYKKIKGASNKKSIYSNNR